MKNLTFNLEDEISILSKYRITPNELMLIRTLLLLKDEDNVQIFQDYIELLHDDGIKLRDILLCLRGKGIINKTTQIPEEGQRFDPYSVDINKTFTKGLYKCSFEMGKELFETYPQFGSVQGNLVGLRSISKRFDSLEDAYFRYGKSIRWDEKTHRHIIDLVKWAKDNNIINYTLTSFIIDQRWLELEALQNGDANINYDNIKLL